MEFDPLSKKVIGLAIEVHKELGPGLLESTYEKCLAHELRLHDIECITQKILPVSYKGLILDCGYRIDLMIEDSLVVELKTVESLAKIHEAQLLTYMKLAQINIGLLINFNSILLRNGIKRFVF
ncbi:MAG: GxxExxY protein [Gammaproteobacteria bacterium]|nr:GxxExxY protein [Gammaproteobacteria bacterium]